MTATDSAKRTQRQEQMATLRGQHPERVAAAQARLKEQRRIRKVLRQALRDGSRTVPQLASDTALAAHEVLWHIAAMKKYGAVVEDGMDEDYEYFRYGLAKGTKA